MSHPQPKQSQTFLKPKQAAKELQVSQRTVQRMCERGEIPAKKVGRQWRISADYKEHLPGSEKAA